MLFGLYGSICRAAEDTVGDFDSGCDEPAATAREVPEKSYTKPYGRFAGNFRSHTNLRNPYPRMEAGVRLQ